MRVADILFAFPGLLFVFFIAATIKPGIVAWAKTNALADLARSGYLDYAVVIFALGVIGWAGLARLVRGAGIGNKNQGICHQRAGCWCANLEGDSCGISSRTL